MLDLVLLCALAPQGGPAPVVINEFVYDDGSSSTSVPDLREFVELYNRTSSPIDISGWAVVAADTGGVKKTYTIPGSTILPGNDYWVIGSPTVPNVDQIVGTADLLENDQEALVLYDGNGRIIDTLVYEANKIQPIWNPAFVEGQGVWGNFTSSDTTPSVGETSWQRMLDGHDTNNNGRDFRLGPTSPGQSNNLPPRPVFGTTFDGGTVDAPVTEFAGSFKFPHHVDPTQISQFNRKVRPLSPQGGKAMAAWDDVGGGNSNMFLALPVADVIVEAYVYFDAKLENAGYYESWSFGVQGTTCGYFNTPDPTKGFGFTANGNTGVCWTFQVTDRNAVLYLVDHNDGGTDFTVLGSIPLQAGVNDGWQRLRLEVSGEHAQGWFGGTYGGSDGQQLFGRIKNPGIGGIWIGYREFVASFGDDPFLCDFLTIRPGLGRVRTIGSAVATTRGTPLLEVNGFPKVGWNGFTIRASGLVPSQSTLLFLGASLLSPPLNLQLLGGQPGSNLYVTPDLLFLPPADAQGVASLTIPVPPDPGFAGVSVYWQDLDFDPALPVALKLGNSAALETRVTN
jgi:hypothetical protein